MNAVDGFEYCPHRNNIYENIHFNAKTSLSLKVNHVRGMLVHLLIRACPNKMESAHQMIFYAVNVKTRVGY